MRQSLEARPRRDQPKKHEKTNWSWEASIESLEDRCVPAVWSIGVEPGADFDSFGAALAAVQVVDGDTLQVAAGTYAESVTIDRPLIVQPTGTVAIAGDFVLGPAATLTVEIAGTTAGQDYGQIVAEGVVNLGSAALDVSLAYTPQTHDNFTIVTSDAAPIEGMFEDRYDDSDFHVDGRWVGIDYSNGVELTVQPITFLDEYVNTIDPAYQWSVTGVVVRSGYRIFRLRVVSGSWRSASEVNRPVWEHRVNVFVPDTILHDTALLFIDGGNNSTSPNTSFDDYGGIVAVGSGSVLVHLPQVPNQPLIFAEDGVSRTEDSIIAFSFKKFLQTGDETWPALLPMTRAAVRTMDAAQALVTSIGGMSIENFVVAGASKRGWTAWLTAAVDPRVTAVVPIVADLLNTDRVFQHHFEVYGFWSSAINDYVNQGIVQQVGTGAMAPLEELVDPYSYLRRLTMPKLMVNSTGDEFFVADTWQYYYQDLIGPKWLRFFPNTGHSLAIGGDILGPLLEALTFYNATLNQHHIPEYAFQVLPNGSLELRTSAPVLEASMWRATNANARDFRYPVIGAAFANFALVEQEPGVYIADVPMPASGWTAFLIEVLLEGQDGDTFRFSSGVHVKGPQPAWLDGTLWHDLDGNGAWTFDEPTLAGHDVYLDLNGNGQHDGYFSGRINSTFVPRRIPPSGTTGTTVIPLEVTGTGGPIYDVNVHFDITHTRLRDLTLRLISPAGTEVQLFTNVGTGTRFNNTTLDDNASVRIAGATAPYTGVYKPQNPLSAFQGESADGVWLLVIDDTVSTNSGDLNSWGLTLQTGEPITQTDANGKYRFIVEPGDYTVRALGPEGWSPTNAFDGNAINVAYAGRAFDMDFGFQELVVQPVTVTDIFVAGQSWTAAFFQHLQQQGEGEIGFGYRVPTGSAAQLLPLPWIGLDRISIRFNRDLVIAMSDLRIFGVNVVEYFPTQFDYDPETFTATWTLPQPLNHDSLRLWIDDQLDGNTLDGEWTDGTSTQSGDGEIGGHFSALLNLLPGDVQQNGSVFVADVLAVRDKQFLFPGQSGYSHLFDVDGSGSIFVNDILAVRNRQFTFLPPEIPSGPESNDESTPESPSAMVNTDESPTLTDSVVLRDLAFAETTAPTSGKRRSALVL